jgi:putative transposase
VKSLRDWHAKLAPESESCGDAAATAAMQEEIKCLRKRLLPAEMESLATPLVSSSLRNAVESRKPDTKGLVHHSDRGSQYTSDENQQTLRTLNMTCSMSRTGCCYDNAVMERFFWLLKHEWTKFETFDNIDQARLCVFQYIETFYNSKPIHQTLEYRTPDEFEEQH